MKSQADDRIQDATVGFALVGGLAFGLVLFVLVPNIITQQLAHFHVIDVDSWMLLNFVSECIKIVFFLSYIWLIGRMPDIKRVFMYHGAEHKAINTLEAHQDLTIDNCLAQTRLHPRCGTSFAIVVLILSMVLMTFVYRYPFPAMKNVAVLASLYRFIVELLLLPVIAGLSYELIRLAGKFRNSTLIKTLFFPGLMTQYLTTNEPDSTQVEVALAALKAVVDAEKADQNEPTETEASAIA